MTHGERAEWGRNAFGSITGLDGASLGGSVRPGEAFVGRGCRGPSSGQGRVRGGDCPVGTVVLHGFRGGALLSDGRPGQVEETEQGDDSGHRRCKSKNHVFV